MTLATALQHQRDRVLHAQKDASPVDRRYRFLSAGRSSQSREKRQSHSSRANGYASNPSVESPGDERLYELG
jgi:hypothetical protein